MMMGRGKGKQYGNPGVSRDKLSEAQKAVCDSLEEVIPQIMESLESTDGYRLEREDSGISR